MAFPELTLHPRTLVHVFRWALGWALGQWQAIDRDCDAERDHSVMAQYVRPVVVLVLVAIVLTLQEYWGHRPVFMRYFEQGETSTPDYQLQSFVWWSGWRFGGYVLLPILAIVLMPGERLRDYFVSFRGFFRHLWIYVSLFGLILPAVILAARTASFSHTYPFFKYAHLSWKYFLAWELMYALQFVSLEFFFRGFMLYGLRDRFGSAAIFVMIVPYCMIHYGKPMPETLGAIGAGLILGTLAMRTRSIWGGAAIHIAVALTMDWLAMGHCPPASTGRPCSSGY